jgi:hypothetical protein
MAGIPSRQTPFAEAANPVTSFLTFAGRPTKMQRCRTFRAFSDMDASLISGVAALTGAAIGGLTSAAAAWFTQRAIAKSQWLASETARRQDIYRDFIEVSAKCYIDALQHENPDIPGLIGIYAKISRMRVLSAANIVDSAERVAQRILDTYAQPDKSFVELRSMANDHAIDLLHVFSKACRMEYEHHRARQF